MFNALNKNEMMNVNGGFKYIPVYQITRYYQHGGFVGQSPKKYVGQQQVTNNDTRPEIIRYVDVSLT